MFLNLGNYLINTDAIGALHVRRDIFAEGCNEKGVLFVLLKSTHEFPTNEEDMEEAPIVVGLEDIPAETQNFINSLKESPAFIDPSVKLKPVPRTKAERAADKAAKESRKVEAAAILESAMEDYDKKALEEVAETPPVPAVGVTEESIANVTIDEVRKQFKNLAVSVSKEVAFNVLDEFGAKKISLLDPSRYADILRRIKELSDDKNFTAEEPSLPASRKSNKKVAPEDTEFLGEEDSEDNIPQDMFGDTDKDVPETNTSTNASTKGKLMTVKKTDQDPKEVKVYVDEEEVFGAYNWSDTKKGIWFAYHITNGCDVIKRGFPTKKKALTFISHLKNLEQTDNVDWRANSVADMVAHSTFDDSAELLSNITRKARNLDGEYEDDI